MKKILYVIVLACVILFASMYSMTRATKEGNDTTAPVVPTETSSFPVDASSTPDVVASNADKFLSSEYTNKDFHYSIEIPEGWRIIKMTPMDNGELRLTNSKDSDEEILAYVGNPGSAKRSSPEATKFFSSMISIWPSHYEKQSINPLVGQQINVGTTSVRETLLTTSGNEVVYKFRTQDRTPQSGVADIASGGLLENGSVANKLFIIFPVDPVFSDKEARRFLTSLQLF